VVNLTPDDIERRTFALEERGYNRDEVRKFLFEVAARLRLAFHTTQPPVSYKSRRAPAEPTDEPGATEAPSSVDAAATTDPFGTGLDPTDDPAARPSRNGNRTHAHDDLANPLGDPLAALAGTSDFSAPSTSALDAFADQATAEAVEAAEAVDAIGALEPADGYQQLGAEVAEVLRAAHDAVAARREQAEKVAEAVRAEAHADAAEIRRQAEADAVWQHDRAKRVLIAAQEQADAIVAETESQAKAIIASAREQAEEHAQHVAAQARRHAETILKAEREALHRLHDAKAGLTAAIDFIGAGECRPVVDLTNFRPYVQLGHVSVEMQDDHLADSDAAAQDPLVRMVRHAVDRAVDGAAEHAVEHDTDVDRDTDEPEPADAAEPPSTSSGHTLDPMPDTPAAV